MAALFERAGESVFYIGKPHPLAYRSAMEQFAHFNLFKESEILMIGDTPEIDIRGAKGVGMASALVTRTGIMSSRNIEEIPEEDVPDFLLERFS